MNNVDRRSLSDLALASHTTSFHLDFFSTRNLASRLDQLFSSFFFSCRTPGIWHKLNSQQTSPAYSHPRPTRPHSYNKARTISFIRASCRRVSTETTAICMLMPLVSYHSSPFRLRGSFPLDLLSLSNGTPVHVPRPLPVHSQTAPQTVPASVPSHPSYLSATRPQATQEKAGKENAPKARRMSSSTTGVLGRGKLGLTGTGESGSGPGGVGKDR